MIKAKTNSIEITRESLLIISIICPYLDRVCGIDANVPALGEVASFGTDYFLLKIKFLAKYKLVFTAKFAILPNAC